MFGYAAYYYGAHLQDFEHCAMRPMPREFYELGVRVWHKLWRHLPKACRHAPPNWCSAQLRTRRVAATT